MKERVVIEYQTKSGKRGLKPELGVDVEEEDFDWGVGWCVGCGYLHPGVEPDARRYACDLCGERRVYGLEELALMNLIA